MTCHAFNFTCSEVNCDQQQGRGCFFFVIPRAWRSFCNINRSCIESTHGIRERGRSPSLVFFSLFFVCLCVCVCFFSFHSVSFRLFYFVLLRFASLRSFLFLYSFSGGENWSFHSLFYCQQKIVLPPIFQFKFILSERVWSWVLYFHRRHAEQLYRVSM